MPTPPDPSAADSVERVINHVVEKHTDDLIDLRRDLHRHPELSWEERRTTDWVVEILEHIGWRVTPSQRSGDLTLNRVSNSPVAFIALPLRPE